MMRRIAVALLTALPLLAMAENYGSARVSEVTSIYDGDTFRANIEGWPAIIGERVPVRIMGIDTPELRSRCSTETGKEREKRLAREAKQFTVARLRGADEIVLEHLDRGSFFRVLAEVRVDGESLGESLMAAGPALRKSRPSRFTRRLATLSLWISPSYSSLPSLCSSSGAWP
ncbi:thermonuclease family protein [Halomonas sp. IOP_31]|uniref:thermonuclease family protein n=1 Tax=Halomonas sp. IOP_31 TaxID=2876584 RepID=UPI001E62FECF|nr:thermonuclease family protein [Halomonas sp. IOP_31]MCD6006921.1 thermonuclease family protein [Halomonas sp. IOP_31]